MTDGSGKRITEKADGALHHSGLYIISLLPTMPRRKSLLIGINYFNSSNELAGCINDVENGQFSSTNLIDLVLNLRCHCSPSISH